MYAQPLPNNADRARWATSMLTICLCIYGIMFVRDVFKLFAENIYYMNYGLVTAAEAVIEGVGSLLIITTSVFFIMWFRRAYNNLHIAGARFLPYSEGWAAGGWFIPILNYFYPYRIMNAIWVETPAAIRKVGERHEPAKQGIVGAWWAFWVIGNIVSSIESQVILRAGVSVSDISVTVLDFISDGCLVAAAWMGIRMIKMTAEMELDLHGRYNEWLAYQTQLHAQQYNQQQAFSTPNVNPHQGPQQ